MIIQKRLEKLYAKRSLQQRNTRATVIASEHVKKHLNTSIESVEKRYNKVYMSVSPRIDTHLKLRKANPDLSRDRITKAAASHTQSSEDFAKEIMAIVHKMETIA